MPATAAEYAEQLGQFRNDGNASRYPQHTPKFTLAEHKAIDCAFTAMCKKLGYNRLSMRAGKSLARKAKERAL